MSQLVIIPIHNRANLFPGQQIILSDNIFLEKLSDEEFGTFHRDSKDGITSNLDLKNTKCIKIKVNDPDIQGIKNIRTASVFALNILGANNPIVTTWACHFIGEKKLKIKSIIEFESLAGIKRLTSNPFKFNSTVNRASLIQFYSLVNETLSRAPISAFTMEKFNSSLLRDDFLDKLLDTTICFESLIPGNVELVYRISQNIAFIVGTSAEERLTIFENIKKLYDVRSKLVHGDLYASNSIGRKIAEVRDNWPTFIRYLKLATSYYVMYLSTNSREAWDNHLKCLVLGTQNKLV